MTKKPKEAENGTGEAEMGQALEETMTNDHAHDY